MFHYDSISVLPKPENYIDSLIEWNSDQRKLITIQLWVGYQKLTLRSLKLRMECGLLDE